MIGAYLAWQIVQWIGPGGEGFWLAVLGAAAGVAVLGGVIERLLLRHLYRREELYQLLFTYALVLVIADMAKLLWGTQQFGVSRPPTFEALPAPRPMISKNNKGLNESINALQRTAAGRCSCNWRVSRTVSPSTPASPGLTSQRRLAFILPWL